MPEKGNLTWIAWRTADWLTIMSFFLYFGEEKRKRRDQGKKTLLIIRLKRSLWKCKHTLSSDVILENLLFGGFFLEPLAFDPFCGFVVVVDHARVLWRNAKVTIHKRECFMFVIPLLPLSARVIQYRIEKGVLYILNEKVTCYAYPTKIWQPVLQYVLESLTFKILNKLKPLWQWWAELFVVSCLYQTTVKQNDIQYFLSDWKFLKIILKPLQFQIMASQIKIWIW